MLLESKRRRLYQLSRKPKLPLTLSRKPFAIKIGFKIGLHRLDSSIRGNINVQSPAIDISVHWMIEQRTPYRLRLYQRACIYSKLQLSSSALSPLLISPFQPNQYSFIRWNKEFLSVAVMHATRWRFRPTRYWTCRHVNKQSETTLIEIVRTTSTRMRG